MDGKWVIESSEQIYEGPWGRVEKYAAKSPGRSVSEERVALRPIAETSAHVVVHTKDKGFLLTWTHNIATHRWGWTIPGGTAKNRELAHETGARCVAEQTGWKTGKVSQQLELQALGEMLEQRAIVCTASDATWEGPGRDAEVAGDIAWLDADEILKAVDKGDVSDAVTLAAVLYVMRKQLFQ